MPSLTTQGTAYLFGVDADVFTNTTVQDFSLDNAFNNESEVKDKDGNVVSKRYDDLTVTGSASMTILSTWTEPTLGTKFTYETVDYWITGSSIAYTNDAHTVYSITFQTSEFITPA